MLRGQALARADSGQTPRNSLIAKALRRALSAFARLAGVMRLKRKDENWPRAGSNMVGSARRSLLPFDSLVAWFLDWNHSSEPIGNAPLSSLGFRCNKAGLYSISVLLEPAQGTANTSLFLDLFQLNRLAGRGSNPVRIAGPLSVRDLKRPRWFSFEFAPLQESLNSRYVFRLRAGEAQVGTQVAALQGVSVLSSGTRPIQLAFMARCRSESSATANFEVFRKAFVTGDTRVDHTPLMLRLEISRVCNLRCIMCVRGLRPFDAANERPGFMSMATFKKILPILPNVTQLNAFGLGEPMLNPNFLEMLALARATNPRMRVCVSTNGCFLSPEVNSQIVSSELVTEFQVSIDGACAETYERIRPSGNYETVIKNLTNLIATRRQAKSALPRVKVQMVVMEQNRDEILPLVAQMDKLGVDVVELDLVKGETTSSLGVREAKAWDSIASQIDDARQLLSNSPTQLGGLLLDQIDVLQAEAHARRPSEPAAVQAPQLSPKAPEDRAPQVGAKTVRMSRKGTTKSEVSLRLPSCSSPWEQVVLTTEGHLRPCCVSGQIMGDVEQAFDHSWNGDAYQRLRSEHARGNVNRWCSECLDARTKDPSSVNVIYTRDVVPNPAEHRG